MPLLLYQCLFVHLQPLTDLQLENQDSNQAMMTMTLITHTVFQFRGVHLPYHM